MVYISLLFICIIAACREEKAESNDYLYMSHSSPITIYLFINGKQNSNLRTAWENCVRTEESKITFILVDCSKLTCNNINIFPTLTIYNSLSLMKKYEQDDAKTALNSIYEKMGSPFGNYQLSTYRNQVIYLNIDKKYNYLSAAFPDINFINAHKLDHIVIQSSLSEPPQKISMKNNFYSINSNICIALKPSYDCAAHYSGYSIFQLDAHSGVIVLKRMEKQVGYFSIYDYDSAYKMNTLFLPTLSIHDSSSARQLFESASKVCYMITSNNDDSYNDQFLSFANNNHDNQIMYFSLIDNQDNFYTLVADIYGFEESDLPLIFCKEIVANKLIIHKLNSPLSHFAINEFVTKFGQYPILYPSEKYPHENPHSPVIKLVGKSFAKNVLEAKTDVVVLFHSNNCGPCEKFLQVLQKISKEFKEAESPLVFAELENNRNKIADQNIVSLPTLKYFKNGKSVAIYDGDVEYGKIQGFIKLLAVKKDL